MEVQGNETVKRVCVTGAAGYIGSWLVKNLLERGYTVNATLRNPGDETKSGPLLKLPGAEERLKLFKADLYLEGSFDSAVEGCHGVFHVASPTDFTKSNPVSRRNHFSPVYSFDLNPSNKFCGRDVASQDDFIVPAVNGIQNVMKACVRAKSVRRFVYTSSVGAASPRNDKGEFTHTCLDGTCWSPINFLKSQTHKVAWYSIAKTLAEQEALKYGLNNNIEVVSILPGLVIGPWLTDTSTVTSAQAILGLLGENNGLYEILKYTEFMLGSIPIVHIDDTCNAHIFLMEHTDAQNRYVCSSESMSLKGLTDLLAKNYPQFRNSTKLNEDDHGAHVYLPVSSQNLLDMGFSYKYQLEEALDESIECAIKSGLLQL